MAKAANTELHAFLVELARSAKPGERLPAIRQLMRQFRVSQVVVERGLQDLKARGLIASEVGRGTYFRGGDASDRSMSSAEPRAFATQSQERTNSRSILLLRRSISIARGRILLEGLQGRFAADKHRVLEVAYTDPNHARQVLKGLPHLDACVVQSTFKTITVDLLADLRAKCDVLAVDGVALSGTDVEAVGMEWGEPLEEAIEVLRRHGHRRIVYASTLFPSLAGQMGERRFAYLKKRLSNVELLKIDVPALPDESYEQSLVRLLVERLASDPFTGLIAWGIEDGRRFYQLLGEAGLAVPDSLSVVLLGRTDLANEHADYFYTIGCQVADQVDQLYEAVKARWADPGAPYAVRLIPVTVRAGDSVGDVAPQKVGGEDASKRLKRGAAATAQ